MLQRGSWFLFLFVFSFILECIPQEAEARGRRRCSFGRCGARRGVVRRVNRNRGVVRRNNFGRQRVFVRNNNDIFGLDQEPVNVFSSLQVNPFGQLQPIIDGRGNVISGLATNGQGRFFAVNSGFNSPFGFNRFNVIDNRGFEANLGNLNNQFAVQAELLRSNGTFFGGINPVTGGFVPNSSLDSTTFNNLQFLNTVGALSTQCNGRFCQVR